MQAPKDYWHQRFAHATLHSAALTSLLSGPQLYSTQTAHCYLPSPHTHWFRVGEWTSQQAAPNVVKAWGQPWLLNLPSSDFWRWLGVLLSGHPDAWCLSSRNKKSWGYFDMLAICSFSWYCFPWFKSKLEMTPSPQSLTSLRNVCV